MNVTPRQSPLTHDEIEPHACSVQVRLGILRRVPFFHDLSDAELAEVNLLFHERGYTAGEFIYFTGDPATRLYVVATGKVKLLGHSAIGQEIVLDLLTAGEFLGSLPALGDRTYPDTAVAHTPCCILSIAAGDFGRLLQRYPSVTLALLGIVTERLSDARERVRQMSAQSVESRVAAMLLKLGDKLGEAQPDALLIQVPLSRQDLADMTGATLETVSRTMSQFRKDGLIRSGRRWVAITDRRRLAAIAAG